VNIVLFFSRLLGLKVSDEFTVPLCRGHHRQLHQAGNEAAWWEDLDINALEIAQTLGRKPREDISDRRTSISTASARGSTSGGPALRREQITERTQLIRKTPSARQC
jgi:hypothetical protein